MTKYIPTWLIGCILFVAFLGFMDASFLTGEHFLKMTPPCFITSGCDTVTTSTNSKLFGIPVALLGMIYYITVLGTAMHYADKRKAFSLKALHLITSVGLLMSVYFLYVQGLVLHAWCIYCLGSAMVSTILFILVSLAHYKNWPEKNKETTII